MNDASVFVSLGERKTFFYMGFQTLCGLRGLCADPSVTAPDLNLNPNRNRNLTPDPGTD